MDIMKRNSEQILTEWLVLKARSGDARAINLLVKEWHPKLRRYASRQIRDEEAAKDVVQDTFMTVTKGIRKLKDPAAFPRWIYQILHRRGVDYIRRKTRSRRNDDLNVAVNQTLNVDKTTESLDIQKALRNLDSDSYQVVHLHYLHGFNLKEVSRITGVPEGTVKSRLYSARNHLRQLLGGEDHE
jgi:RNA polymerase sigma-70 factor (ECF subfamily)